MKHLQEALREAGRREYADLLGEAKIQPDPKVALGTQGTQPKAGELKRAIGRHKATAKRRFQQAQKKDLGLDPKAKAGELRAALEKRAAEQAAKKAKGRQTFLRKKIQSSIDAFLGSLLSEENDDFSAEALFLNLVFEAILDEVNATPVLEAFDEEGFDTDYLLEVFDIFFDELDEGLLARVFGVGDKKAAKARLQKKHPEVVVREIGGGTGAVTAHKPGKKFGGHTLGSYKAAGQK